ncbi:Cat operon transcriptional regulator [Raoultella ornithinolytica]|nr:Cat operon transcriptional regulator [Raoultella ornithinolytica]
MDIRLIRAFVTLAQLRRYHAAAERLCLTQPALTKQIQTLEHLTGMTLFQRGRQGAQLTAAGEAIYSQACHFVAQHDQFCAWTEQVRRGNVGTLALGFGISTFQLAPAQVKAFRQQFPDIESPSTISLPTSSIECYWRGSCMPGSCGCLFRRRWRPGR